ncbi:MAG TPA: hypothetical protein VFV38_25530 [Ktedonobacteraceae bacterium]|nr:hypothetical protein [Ktedonobacteraceae bacterium]
MDEIVLSGWKDPQAFEQNKPCYADEQGTLYSRDDFLSVCNGDGQVARQVFDLCYWQSPAFQFALYEESIHIPDLSHHSRSAAHWLIWHVDPTTDQQAALQQSGWTAQDTRTWMITRDVWSVPWGIAFRDTGVRDLTPQETAERRQERARDETLLSKQAQVRYDQFKADMRADLTRMSRSTVYIVDQLPRDLAGWNRLEDTNGRGLRALFFTQLAETPEALWEALDRLPANCQFTVTERTHLRPTAQVKGCRRGGDIIKVRSREVESTFLPVFAAIMERINRESSRERLLRLWRRADAACEKQIAFEKHRIEWFLLHRRLSRDLFQDRQGGAENPGRTLLTLCGWQSAFTFAREALAALPNEMTEGLAHAFLTDLTKQHEESIAAQAQSESSILWSLAEEGRSNAFSVLSTDASAFLVPDESL